MPVGKTEMVSHSLVEEFLGDQTTYVDENLMWDEEWASEHVFLATRENRARFVQARTYDLTRPPANQKEAHLRQDSARWRAAEKREVDRLWEMKTFTPTTLPPGRKALRVHFVYDQKVDEHGKYIPGKEKARLVVDGCRQRPEDYSRTSSR